MCLIPKPHFWIYIYLFQTDLFHPKIYDKRNDFDFDVVIFCLLNVEVHCSSSYGVYISHFIPFARVPSHVTDFNARNKILTAKLLQQGYQYHKLPKAFSQFYSQE